VTYSVTDEASFQAINKWMNQIQNLAPKDVKILLVGNKIDLTNDRVISTEMGWVIREIRRVEIRR
jgi:GTPase SAR1 family protein